jgi:hypothetical protein
VEHGLVVLVMTYDNGAVPGYKHRKGKNDEKERKNGENGTGKVLIESFPNLIKGNRTLMIDLVPFGFGVTAIAGKLPSFE